ncbi:MAG: hypothetical protein O2794_02885 [bacterium]|nr:hypothetical protein [bacterium]
MTISQGIRGRERTCVETAVNILRMHPRDRDGMLVSTHWNLRCLAMGIDNPVRAAEVVLREHNINPEDVREAERVLCTH